MTTFSSNRMQNLFQQIQCSFVFVIGKINSDVLGCSRKKSITSGTDILVRSWCICFRSLSFYTLNKNVIHKDEVTNVYRMIPNVVEFEMHFPCIRCFKKYESYKIYAYGKIGYRRNSRNFNNIKLIISSIKNLTIDYCRKFKNGLVTVTQLHRKYEFQSHF